MRSDKVLMKAIRESFGNSKEFGSLATGWKAFDAVAKEEAKGAKEATEAEAGEVEEDEAAKEGAVRAEEAVEVEPPEVTGELQLFMSFQPCHHSGGHVPNGVGVNSRAAGGRGG